MRKGQGGWESQTRWEASSKGKRGGMRGRLAKGSLEKWTKGWPERAARQVDPGRRRAQAGRGPLHEAGVGCQWLEGGSGGTRQR